MFNHVLVYPNIPQISYQFKVLINPSQNYETLPHLSQLLALLMRSLITLKDPFLFYRSFQDQFLILGIWKFHHVSWYAFFFFFPSVGHWITLFNLKTLITLRVKIPPPNNFPLLLILLIISLSLFFFSLYFIFLSFCSIFQKICLINSIFKHARQFIESSYFFPASCSYFTKT